MIRTKIAKLLLIALLLAPVASIAGDGIVSTQNPLEVAADGGAQQQPDNVPSVAADPRTLEQLEEKLNTLEAEVKRLREQQEARRRLEMDDEEKKNQEKQILESAGRQYTTMKRNTLGLEYNFNYQYYSYDVISEATEVEKRANHNLTNSIYIEYALLDNLTLNLNLPFVYKWDNAGTEQAIETTEIGDVSTGFQYQPLRIKGRWPAMILLGRATFPTGQSPYEINIDEELATGSGYYSIYGGLSLSKTVDPVIIFGNIGYTYNFEEDDLNQKRNQLELTGVSPGDVIGGTVGMGFSLSYNVSMNFSYQYLYRENTVYSLRQIPSTDSGSRVSSLFFMGTGFRFSPKYSINVKVGIGLTDDDPDFTVGIRLPFEF